MAENSTTDQGHTIYHEKQRKQFCAIHSMNNLFQDATICTKEKLDEVCYNLNPSRWNNPHKSLVGTGNYDINVITAFLHTQNYDVIWFDKRKSIESIHLEKVFGFLLNRTMKYKIFNTTLPLISTRFKHWYVVRMLRGGLYFNLDSKLNKPVNIGNTNKLVEFLGKQLSDDYCELLLIVKSGVNREEILDT